MTISCIVCKEKRDAHNITRAFHRFPSNDNIKKAWMEVIGVSSISKNAMICSDHFDEKYYHQTDGYTYLRRLINNAVPSINLYNKSNKELCKSNQTNNVTMTTELQDHLKSFPTNHNIRMHWIEATGRKHWTPRISSRICSTHFEKKLLIKKKKTTFLIHEAVPRLVPRNSTRLQVLKPVEINDKSTILKSKLTPHIDLVSESDDTLSATSDDPQSPRINGSSVPKSFLYAQQRMQQKLQNALKQSSNRLKKLRALREKYRRLTKKVVKLENVIAELKTKSPTQTSRQPS